MEAGRSLAHVRPEVKEALTIGLPAGPEDQSATVHPKRLMATKKGRHLDHEARADSPLIDRPAKVDQMIGLPLPPHSKAEGRIRTGPA